MKRDRQLKMMQSQYASSGWVVIRDADLSVIGIDIPSVRPTFLCSRGDEHLIVTVMEIGSALADDEFVILQDAIENRPEIEWEIRFFDISASVHQLVDEIIKVRNHTDDPFPYDNVLAMMKALGLYSEIAQ